MKGKCYMIETLLCMKVRGISFLDLGIGPWEPVAGEKP